jgi:hypothetical protein
MRTLILSSGLLAVALVGGPQTAVAQNEPAFCLQRPTGSLNCIYDSMAQCTREAGSTAGRCVPNPTTTGQGRVSPLPLPGGGEYLPPASPPSPAVPGQGRVSPLPPAGGGEYLPQPSR